MALMNNLLGPEFANSLVGPQFEVKAHCRSLRFGRDDKGEGSASVGIR
jgi:hypothetical protein